MKLLKPVLTLLLSVNISNQTVQRCCRYLRGPGVLLVQPVILPVLLLVLQVVFVQFFPNGFNAILLHHLILNTRTIFRSDESTRWSSQWDSCRPAGVWRQGRAAWHPVWGCTGQVTHGGNGWWAPPPSWRSKGRRSRTFPLDGRSLWACCCLLSWRCTRVSVKPEGYLLPFRVSQ